MGQGGKTNRFFRPALWYNTTMRTDEKKQTGSFYTPENLACALAREVLDAWQRLHPQTRWADVQILDPAAGEGGLLLPFARELAARRATQEPKTTPAEILRDVHARQLFAADISARALAKTGLPHAHVYHGDALAAENGKSVLEKWGKFDIVLANPPYIGQKNHAKIFNALRHNPLWAPYVTPKNDLLYYFFYLALHVLKPGGVAGFITTPYFATAAGGKMLRQTLQKNATFLRLINFEDQRLFKDANPHILLSVFTRGKADTPCRVGQPAREATPQDLFYGPELFLHTRPTDSREKGLLARMAAAPKRLGEIAHISNGLMTGCDQAFILSQAQKEALPLTKKELAKLKPFFKNSDIAAYVASTQPRLWLIDFFYPGDRGLDITQYPHLLTHLAQFKDKLLARKQNNNGIDKQLAQGRFWFGSVRRKLNFEQEKILLPHRAPAVLAAYSNGPWYASSDVYFITHPQPPYTIWALLGLLNSAPYLAWLKAHGKRKGRLLELYSAPLKQLPIPNLTPKQQAQLEKLTRNIYGQLQTGESRNLKTLQEQRDRLVVQLF